jgi:hypothetical protein
MNRDNIAPPVKPAVIERVSVAMRKEGKTDDHAASTTGIIKNPSRY